MTWPPPIENVSGVPLDQEEPKTCPVRQITPVYWTATSWPLCTTAPLPLIRVFTCRVAGGAAPSGIAITGPAVLPGAGGVTVGSGRRRRLPVCRGLRGAERRDHVDDEHQGVAVLDALLRVA